MILDVTAGNRTMWRCKRPDNVVYVDVELELRVPPDVIADSRYLPFRPGVFDVVFFDPPHAWNKRSSVHSDPKRTHGAYYGWERYRTWPELLKYMHMTVREIRRVLKPGGVVWFKWSSTAKPIDRVLSVFTGWRELLRIRSGDSRARAPAWWVMMT